MELVLYDNSATKKNSIKLAVFDNGKYVVTKRLATYKTEWKVV